MSVYDFVERFRIEKGTAHFILAIRACRDGKEEHYLVHLVVGNEKTILASSTDPAFAFTNVTRPSPRVARVLLPVLVLASSCELSTYTNRTIPYFPFQLTMDEESSIALKSFTHSTR